MAETLFEFLFKYRPLLYERGDIAFSAPPAWVLLSGAALAAVAVLTYARVRSRSRRGDRLALAGIRIALLAVLLLLLARPVLLVPTIVPQENYLGILIDDSRSMRIDDGASRAAFVNDVFLDRTSDLRRALGNRFRLRYFRFSELARRMDAETPLEFAGDRTRLGRALDQARDELGSVPLSGLVLVTDGADNAPAELDEALLGLKADGVPVFTVGVGSTSFRRDIEVSRVSAPASALAGSAVRADVVLSHAGYEGRTVELLVEQQGRIVGSAQVRLEGDGAVTVPVDFTPTEAGPGRFLFRVAVQEGELVDRNNERESLVDVRSGVQKVLYFEGEPRHEVAFIRRAVADDPSIQLVVLQRSDEDKYMRLGVDSAGELAGGFPTTRDELFGYRGLVLGSVEASHFTHDQLSMIAEFVERRGGGLLVLGGRAALAEGGWAGTPVADALPVELGPRRAADSLFHAALQVGVTRDGRTHPITRRPADDTLVMAWDRLPPLSTYNRLGELKPGATALLTGTGGPFPTGQVVLAQQRYGSGRSAVFAVQDSWMWQMHADIPLEDQTFERLWRQLLRWVVSGTPDQVGASVPREAVATGEPVEVRAQVRDARFGGVNHATVRASVLDPSGATIEVPMSWTGSRDGEYVGRFTPAENGPYDVEVEAAWDSITASAGRTEVRAAPSMAEYYGAAMREPALRRIADATGGRFYRSDDIATLPEDISYTARGVTVIEENELWDTPAAFMVILLLVTLEWMYRRRRGLA